MHAECILDAGSRSSNENANLSGALTEYKIRECRVEYNKTLLNFYADALALDGTGFSVFEANQDFFAMIPMLNNHRYITTSSVFSGF